MSEETLFDRDNYLIAESSRTPPLVPQVLKYTSEDTPPPQVPTRESSLAPSPDEVPGAGDDRKRRRGKTKPSQSDVVVLNQLDPNRPDIAKYALKHALDSESEAEEEVPPPGRNGTQMTALALQQHVAHPFHPGTHNQSSQQATENLDDNEEFVMIGNPDKVGERLTSVRVNGTHEVKFNGLGPPAEIRTTQKDYDTRPPPLQSTSSYARTDNESLSPKLAKYMTNPADINPENVLHPLQRSPPPSNSNRSPQQKQTLPSLHTTLNVDSAPSPYSARSPNMMRAPPATMSHFSHTATTSHSYPSPFSAMSPPSTTDPAAWRTNTSGSVSTNSDYAVTSASTITSMSTPSSAVVHSPHNFPTPSTVTSDQSRRNVQEDDHVSPEHSDQETNGAVNGDGYGNGSFTCSVKGCPAAPFQTQYLLNSHMNVHSDTRPHFCPVSDCPRGPGGQGFKRKNEMIRHGLVHTSPGYVCPFCPDQQHKYPRPDNLQRHVRVHHVDKDRDDPQLRDVLAQRPEGGSRGRRRRLGS